MNTKKRAVAISMIAALSIGVMADNTIAIAQNNTNATSTDSSSLETKVVSIKKKGYDEGVKYVENSEHKEKLKSNGADNYIIQSHIIFSLLNDTNAELTNTEYKSAIREEIKKLPNIEAPSGDSQEAQAAFQDFYDVAVILRDINNGLQSDNVSKEKIAKYGKTINDLDKSFIVDGGPTVAKTNPIQDPAIDSKPSTSSTENTTTEKDKEESTTQQSTKESTTQDSPEPSSPTTSNDKEENKEPTTKNSVENTRPTQSLDNRPMYKNTIDALEGYQMILKNVDPNTVPPKCINARLADIWDKEANISIDTPPTRSQEESSSSTVPSTTKELAAPTTTQEISAPTTTQQMSDNIEGREIASPMALIITDEEVDNNILDLAKDNNIEKFSGTTIKLGEKDLVVNASCINDFFGATEDSEKDEEIDDDFISDKNSSVFDTYSPGSHIGQDAILDMDKAVEDDSYLDDFIQNSDESEFINADTGLVDDTTYSSSDNNDAISDEQNVPQRETSSHQEEVGSNSSFNNNHDQSNTSVKRSSPQVVGTQPGQYSPSGARVIDSQTSSPSKKGYWNGSRYVSEEEFLRGGVSSSYSGFEKEGKSIANKKVGPSVNTGGKVQASFIKRIFHI